MNPGQELGTASSNSVRQEVFCELVSKPTRRVMSQAGLEKREEYRSTGLDDSGTEPDIRDLEQGPRRCAFPYGLGECSSQPARGEGQHPVPQPAQGYSGQNCRELAEPERQPLSEVPEPSREAPIFPRFHDCARAPDRFGHFGRTYSQDPLATSSTPPRCTTSPSPEGPVQCRRNTPARARSLHEIPKQSPRHEFTKAAPPIAVVERRPTGPVA